MKKIDEIRRDNLLIAIARFKTASALAEAAMTSAAYLSQVKNRQPDSKTGEPKAMGDDVARKIELALKEPEGWMDVDHTPSAEDTMGRIDQPLEWLDRAPQRLSFYAKSLIIELLKTDKNGIETREADALLTVIRLIQEKKRGELMGGDD